MVAWAPADASPSQAKIVVAAIVENGRSGAGDVALRSLTYGLNTLEGRGPDPVEVDLARRAPLALASTGETP